jgi:hypothetical protein
MRRVLLAASWVALAHLAAPSISHAAAPVSECVQVEPETAADGMSLQVRNTCEVEVRCELTWNLRCEGDAPDAPARPMSLVVRLVSDASQRLFASGAACGAKIWEIADDRWECKELR